MSARAKGMRIFYLSFVMLTLELALIRFVPAEVRSVSYFINILLFSSFFGLGLGCILSRKRDLRWLFPLGTSLLFVFLVLAKGIEVFHAGQSDHFWLAGMDPNSTPLLKIPIFLVPVLVFIPAALPFVALGQLLAQAMDLLPRLEAYSWDIAGSLLGAGLFSLTCFFGVPPWVWIIFDIFAASFLVALTRLRRILVWVCALMFLFFARSPLPAHWSPYYHVQYKLTPNRLFVFVNSGFHQMAVNFASQDHEFQGIAEGGLRRYGIPYETFRKYHGGRSPESVLILGAGSGNDVYVALKNRVKRIVAVEIDPSILEIGRNLNWQRPYSDPAVEVINDDGRHYLRTTNELFDLVIFGTLDSQTLLSGNSNLRLENYIYTSESFSDVARLLREGGMVGAYYSIFKPWLTGRLFATIHAAFPGAVRYVEFEDRYLFNLVIMGAKGVPEFRSDPEPLRIFSTIEPLSDDWPFIYLERRTISPLYQGLFLFVALLAFAVFVILRVEQGLPERRLVFFFFGAGFTLVESAAVARLALLFGAVWIVSAIVFFTALSMVFLANLSVWKRRSLSSAAAWFGLFLLLLGNYLTSVEWLLNFGTAIRGLLCFALIGLPIYFAGICFSSLFEKEPNTGAALGLNLVGAMVGGLLEYLSMLLGMRSIWLLAALVYFLALLSLRYRKDSLWLRG